MPTYDYQCRACGAVTEVIHSMLEDGPSACERCGGQLRRVLYPTGIIFKGSGFYKTDSRGSSSSNGGGGAAAPEAPAKSAGAGASSSPDSGASSKSDSGASSTSTSSDGGTSKKSDAVSS